MRLKVAATVLGSIALGAMAAGCTPAGSTSRISVDSSGHQTSSYDVSPSMSDDGSVIAFQAASAIEVRDRSAGTVTTIDLTTSGKPGNGVSTNPVVSGNGQFVAFTSTSTNLVTGDTNKHADVFVRDLAHATTTRVSLTSSGKQANDDSDFAALSATGRYVAFTSAAANLVLGDTNKVQDVFLRDTTSGKTTRVSVRTDGGQAFSYSRYAAVSADGKTVAFESLDPLTSETVDGGIFVRRLTSPPTTTLVSFSNGDTDQLTGDTPPAMSDDGRYVAFQSLTGASDPTLDVYVRDRTSNAVDQISVSSAGTAGNADSGARLTISSDGRYVAFSSIATNLVDQDTNRRQDVFVRDRSDATTTRVSVTNSGAQADDLSEHPDISTDGRYTVFDSAATNLVRDDTNAEFDIFLRDRGA